MERPLPLKISEMYSTIVNALLSKKIMSLNLEHNARREFNKIDLIKCKRLALIMSKYGGNACYVRNEETR